ncbi:hypothetical protein NIES2100_62130 [Calothrix sp. NIES-2100]|nr:hypothetical protein NIES2100_62130 [Calothrix sp. NIES-2100]
MARRQNDHLAVAFKYMLFSKKCHKPIFLLKTVNLYNTIFRRDQACLIQKRT